MSRNSVEVAAAPELVFDVLDDAYAYPRWVVGTRRIRRVDADWPSAGSAFHHAVGVPGAELHDASTVIDRDRPHRMLLEVRFRPTGVASVDITVAPTTTGSAITLEEHPKSGPFARLPRLLTEPSLHLRNFWSLRRLRAEIERREPTD
jgi:uncharacterized protein YndB with AHSA1/START domain